MPENKNDNENKQKSVAHRHENRVEESNKADLLLLSQLGQKAGDIALKWFQKEPQVWMKEGESPVSEADFAVDAFLKEHLLNERPEYGWLSEESDDTLERLTAKRVFVVDPIDGTRGFINGMKQWCISIAVVENNRPVVGVLHCPVLQQTIVASQNGGAFCNDQRLHIAQAGPALGEGRAVLRVTGPNSVQRRFDRMTTMAVETIPFVPSLAYRIAMVAMGDLDIAFARGSAKDWDLAAADLIAHEAGAILTDINGKSLLYNCNDVRHGALVSCAHSCHKEMLDIAKQIFQQQD